jgi:hypothetical protein
MVAYGFHGACSKCGGPIRYRGPKYESRPRHNRYCSQQCFWSHRAEQGLGRTQVKRRALLWYGATKRADRTAGATLRRLELCAAEKILPREGYTEIVLLSETPDRAPFDLTATYRAKRVAIEVTGYLRRSTPGMKPSAEALGMALHIVHISPVDETLYHINRKPGYNFGVPASVFDARVRQVGAKTKGG